MAYRKIVCNVLSLFLSTNTKCIVKDTSRVSEHITSMLSFSYVLSFKNVSKQTHYTNLLQAYLSTLIYVYIYIYIYIYPWNFVMNAKKYIFLKKVYFDHVTSTVQVVWLSRSFI
jgi:hypothetical protein